MVNDAIEHVSLTESVELKAQIRASLGLVKSVKEPSENRERTLEKSTAQSHKEGSLHKRQTRGPCGIV